MREIFQLFITPLGKKLLSIVVSYLCRIYEKTIDDGKEFYVTFVTHGYILNVIIELFLISNILVARIVTPGFALNVPMKYFLWETTTIWKL